MKKTLLIPFLLTLLFQISVADSTKFFDDNATDGDTISDTMIGEDEMSEDDIDRGTRYRVNYGVKTDRSDIDESGNAILYDENNVSQEDFDHAKYETDEFVQLQKDSMAYAKTLATNDTIDANTSDADIEARWSELQNQEVERAELQQRQNDFLINNGSNIDNNREVFMNKKSPLKGGASVMGAMKQNIINTKSPRVQEAENNATEFFIKTVGNSPGYNPKQRLIQSNLGALSEAYKNIDDIAKELTEKLNGSKISCQISRDMVPSYFCPLDGKQGLRFPGTDLTGGGLNGVNVDDELSKCNDFCRTEVREINGTNGDPDYLEGDIPCYSEQILTDKNVISLSDNREIYPNYIDSVAKIEIPANGLMPISNITLNFKIDNPNRDSFPTDEGKLESDRLWNLSLGQDPLKARISTFADIKFNNDDANDTTRTLKTAILKDKVIYFNSSEVKITLSFQETISTKYYIEIRKPWFVYKDTESEFISSGAKLIATDINATYSSDSYFYCSGKQFVGNPLDCKGDTKTIMIAGAPQYLCNDPMHKIGPVPETGGFFDNDSCVTACVRRSSCLSTYSHYTSEGPTMAMLQSEINCVDSDLNGACTEQLCNQYFQDDIFPINEMIVAKDNTIIYTIKNGGLTDYPRPKVDYDKEIANPNIELAWQEEEKDAAYRQMIRDLTYNRIKYRIGEVSETKLAVREAKIGLSQTKIDALLKPKSSDFGKNVFVYSVLKLEHWFSPVAGSWLIGGSSVTVGSGDTNNTLILKDISYAVKTSKDTDEWKLFRRVEQPEALIEKDVQTTNSDGTVTINKQKFWVRTPAYKDSKFGYFNNLTNVFATMDENTETAISFDTRTLSLSQNYFLIPIVSSLEDSMITMEGGFIRNQLPINNKTDFVKVYNEPVIAENDGSYIANYTLYLTYSERPLSYASLMKAIEGNDFENNPLRTYESEKALTGMIDKIKYSTEIEHDGEINNNIQPILKGDMSSQTVSVEWEPSYNEKGKKVYKFIFLYNDSEATDWDSSMLIP